MRSEVQYPDIKMRRDLLRDMRWCINGPMAPPGTPSKHRRVAHGPVVQGGKCARCLEVWKRSK